MKILKWKPYDICLKFTGTHTHIIIIQSNWNLFQKIRISFIRNKFNYYYQTPATMWKLMEEKWTDREKKGFLLNYIICWCIGMEFCPIQLKKHNQQRVTKTMGKSMLCKHTQTNSQYKTVSIIFPVPHPLFPFLFLPSGLEGFCFLFFFCCNRS